MVKAIWNMPIGSAGEWAAAVSTLLAVVVALFGPRWRSKRSQPHLTLEHIPIESMNRFSGARNLAGYSEPQDVHVLQMQVRNSIGRKTAHGVTVQLLHIDELLPNASRRLPIDHSGFLWADSFDLNRPIDLAPGLERKFEVAMLIDQHGETSEDKFAEFQCEAFSKYFQNRRST